MFLQEEYVASDVAQIMNIEKSINYVDSLASLVQTPIVRFCDDFKLFCNNGMVI